MGDINKKERLSLVENKRSIGLFDKLKANADKQGRSINDYIIIVLSKSIEQKGESTLTFTKEALIEIAKHILSDYVDISEGKTRIVTSDLKAIEDDLILFFEEKSL